MGSPIADSAALTDAALVDAARSGERWACEALFRRHARMANGLALRLLGRDAEIDDVVQEAYATVLSGLHRLEDGQAFASFLASIIVRLVRRMLRRRRLARALGLRPPAEPLDVSACCAPDAPGDVVTELRSVYAFVERLPTDERIALLLRRVEGLSLEEAAAVAECSVATVKRRVAAAERRLGEWSAEQASGPRRDEHFDAAAEAHVGSILERRAP